MFEITSHDRWSTFNRRAGRSACSHFLDINHHPPLDLEEDGFDDIDLLDDVGPLEGEWDDDDGEI